jgi:hypothetical protein
MTTHKALAIALTDVPVSDKYQSETLAIFQNNMIK